MTHKGVAPGPITDPHTAAHHTTETQAHNTTNETLHKEDPHHTEVFSGITVYPNQVHYTNNTKKHDLNHLTALTRQPGKTRIESINKSPLMTPHLNTTALMNNPANPMRI